MKGSTKLWLIISTVLISVLIRFYIIENWEWWLVENRWQSLVMCWLLFDVFVFLHKYIEYDSLVLDDEVYYMIYYFSGLIHFQSFIKFINRLANKYWSDPE